MRYYNTQQLVATTKDEITLIIDNIKYKQPFSQNYLLTQKCQSIVDTILDHWFPDNNILIRLTYNRKLTCWKECKQINSIDLNKTIKEYDFDQFQKIYWFI